MASHSGFEAKCVCETCHVEVLLFADAHDVARIEAHAASCPGVLSVRSIDMDRDRCSPSDIYVLGARRWPFAELRRAR